MSEKHTQKRHWCQQRFQNGAYMLELESFHRFLHHFPTARKLQRCFRNRSNLLYTLCTQIIVNRKDICHFSEVEMKHKLLGLTPTPTRKGWSSHQWEG